MASSEDYTSSTLRAKGELIKGNPCKEPGGLYDCGHSSTCKGKGRMDGRCSRSEYHGLVLRETTKCPPCCEKDSALEQEEQEQNKTYYTPRVLGFATGKGPRHYAPPPSKKTNSSSNPTAKSQVSSTPSINNTKTLSASSTAAPTLLRSGTAKPKISKEDEDVWEDVDIAAEMAELGMDAEEDSEWVVL